MTTAVAGANAEISFSSDDLEALENSYREYRDDLNDGVDDPILTGIPLDCGATVDVDLSLYGSVEELQANPAKGINAPFDSWHLGPRNPPVYRMMTTPQGREFVQAFKCSFDALSDAVTIRRAGVPLRSEREQCLHELRQYEQSGVPVRWIGWPAIGPQPEIGARKGKKIDWRRYPIPEGVELKPEAARLVEGDYFGMLYVIVILPADKFHNRPDDEKALYAELKSREDAGQVLYWEDCLPHWEADERSPHQNSRKPLIRKPPIGQRYSESKVVQHDRYQFKLNEEERCRFPTDNGGYITNSAPRDQTATQDGQDGDEGPYPADLNRIVKEVQYRFGAVKDHSLGWPRSAGGLLFVLEPDGRVHYLENVDQFFSWLSRFGLVQWYSKPGFVSQRQFYEEWRRIAQRYDAVEKLPHQPPMPGHYYACDSFPVSDGTAFESLIDRFNPATCWDRELIKALFLTPFAGIPCGSRPAFLITADAGRGAGKTTLAKIVASVCGGLMDFTQNEDSTVIKQRLLTPGTLACRIALLDNVKSLKFSWAELEGLITAETISGKRMYHGEASRPNNLTWIITLNGASLSKDLAQRIVTINLDVPPRSATWEHDIRQFVKQNREFIVADIIGMLSKPGTRLAKYSRWSAWEAAVLSRLDEPETLQKEIVARQGTSDSDEDEAKIVEQFFRDRICDANYNPETDRVFIPSELTARWFNEATGSKHKTVAACRYLSQLESEGTVTYITRGRSKHGSRGMIWGGPEATGELNGDLELRIRKHRPESR